MRAVCTEKCTVRGIPRDRDNGRVDGKLALLTWVCTLSIQDTVTRRLLYFYATLNLYRHSCHNRGIISKRCSIRFILLNKSLHILLPPRCDLIHFLIRVIHHLTQSQPDKSSKFKPAKSGAPSTATGKVTAQGSHDRVALCILC
jgi:hypothetical protein